MALCAGGGVALGAGGGAEEREGRLLLLEAELGGSAVVEGRAVEGHGGASILPS